MTTWCDELVAVKAQTVKDKAVKGRPISNEDEYEAALALVETLMDAAPGSPEEAELERIAMLVEQYEDEHYPIPLPDPADALEFRRDQEGRPDDTDRSG